MGGKRRPVPLDSLSSVARTHVSTVATETEAQYLCALLRIFGIDCQHEESVTASWRKPHTRARDVFVEASQLTDARRLGRYLAP
jgi:hypothetical protein